MAWDYAELSKAAKEVGGPEKLMDLLIESGKDTGHKEMLPVVGIAFVIGAWGYAGISKLVRFFKKKKKISPEAIEAAKAELIKGIKEYEADNPEGSISEETEEDIKVEGDINNA